MNGHLNRSEVQKLIGLLFRGCLAPKFILHRREGEVVADCCMT